MASHKEILGPIVLSLSGGGYRAAAFHLGTLEMLNELGLLDAVAALSTVSGGSITGAAFAAARSDGLTFEEFRNRLYDFMRNTNVITKALDRLSDSSKINDINAMPSLIRSAANVYASESLLGDRTLNSLRSNLSNLNEVVINATDFHTGNSFRFQNSANPDVRSGNNNTKIPPEINLQIRAADAVAASACFPSGFEPIRFPGDFKWPEKFGIGNVREVLGGNFTEEIPLMDGGIFDNQGIDSIKNIFERKGADIGVYIISDTSQRSGNLLDFPVKEKSGVITLRVWYALLLLLALGSLATMVTAAWDFVSLFLSGQLTVYRSIVSELIPFLLSTGVFVLVLYGRYRFKQAAADVEQKTGVQLWKTLKRLTIPELAELVNSRVRSLIVMSSSVFMKHLRNLAFTSLFADPAMNSKLIPNLIYDIDNEPRWGKEIVEAGLQPTKRLRDLACKAESYTTNLWFLNTDDLDTLIECGRATICFKLLKYLLKQKAAEIKAPNSPESKFYEEIKQTWLGINQLLPKTAEVAANESAPSQI